MLAFSPASCTLPQQPGWMGSCSPSLPSLILLVSPLQEGRDVAGVFSVGSFC